MGSDRDFHRKWDRINFTLDTVDNGGAEGAGPGQNVLEVHYQIYYMVNINGLSVLLVLFYFQLV